MPHPDHDSRHPKGVGDDLRERSVVALAMRMGADIDGDRPSREHPHLRRFHQRHAHRCRRGSCARAEAAYLDAARETDPEIPAVLAALRLLSAQRLVTGYVESRVTSLLISAR